LKSLPKPGRTQPRVDVAEPRFAGTQDDQVDAAQIVTDYLCAGEHSIIDVLARRRSLIASRE
jgi:hypothetical protein